jgi:16S rRNA processing protein RimM
VGDRIAVGVIRKPHGVRGEASVELWTDSADRFNELRDVTLVSPDESSTRPATIENARAHLGRALVKFAGIGTPEEVALLRDWTIEIAESEARQLDQGEYFLHDLVGLTLVDAGGRERGRVVGTEEGAGGVLLNVERAGRRFDVPFAAEICREIDLAKKRIIVNLPEGLDEI